MSSNLKEARINAYIRRAQFDLEQALGNSLYYALIKDYDGNDFQTDRFLDLWNGAEFTYQGKTHFFRGCLPLTAALAYSRILEDVGTHVTRAGVKNKTFEFSEEQPQKTVNQKVRNARDDASPYLRDLQLFLEVNQSIYPEADLHQKSVKGFTMTRVGRPRFTTEYNRTLTDDRSRNFGSDKW